MRTVYLKEKSNLSSWKIKRIAKKLEKKNRKEKIVVALCKNLSQNEELIKELSIRKIEILNGRWILKFILYDILELILKKEQKQIETVNIAILINRLEDVLLNQIIEIAKKVKNLKIVTNNKQRAEQVENELYIEYGIPIQITNNKKKALLSPDIIINVDFKEEEINEYEVLENATIINIKHKVKIYNEKFKGNVINDYNIEYNKEIIEGIEAKEKFEKNVLYESVIYRKDTYLHIRKQLEQDEFRLISNSY